MLPECSGSSTDYRVDAYSVLACEERNTVFACGVEAAQLKRLYLRQFGVPMTLSDGPGWSGSMSSLHHHVVSVVLGSTQKQMARTNAATNIAAVQYPEVIRDWPSQQFPHEAVGLMLLPVISGVKLSVTLTVECPYPQPAGRSEVNVRPEQVSGWGAIIDTHRGTSIPGAALPAVLTSAGASSLGMGQYT